MSWPRHVTAPWPTTKILCGIAFSKKGRLAGGGQVTAPKPTGYPASPSIDECEPGAGTSSILTHQEGRRMRLIKFSMGGMLYVGLLDGERVSPLGSGDHALSELLHADNPTQSALELARQSGATVDLGSIRLLAPIDRQEVWGAGLTYERSKQARQKESEQGGSFYDLIYRASRPELFFKATPARVVGPDEAIRVRSDSRWCVPEPELALVI
jgi:hypothetical protein